MGQTTPNKNITIPEKVQEAIRIAQQKVSLHRDEEIRLSRVVGGLEKDVAGLEIKKDTLEGVIPDLEKNVVGIQKKLNEHNAVLEQTKLDLIEIQESRQSEEKARDLAAEEKEAAITKRSEAVDGARIALEEVDVARKALAEEQKAFEVRKKQIRDVLATM